MAGPGTPTCGYLCPHGPAMPFTEQTLFHLAMRASGGTPLPREVYGDAVFNDSDQQFL